MKTENKFVGPIISGREKRLVRKWAVIEKISSLLSKVEDDQVPPWGTKWTNEQIFAIRWTITQLVNMVKIMDEETVEAIPIKWLRMWFTKKASLIGITLMGEIESDWENEHETDRCG